MTTGAAAGADSAGAPLSGIRVLDLTRLLPGGYCTMLMADLGADVVKVEEPGRGDYLRWTPPATSTGESAMHHALGRGKRSVSCNLRAEQGREVFLDLVRAADVVVESFRPGVLDRLGVGYAQLSETNPGLVYAAISGYGQTGPQAQRAGHDINYLAQAGALSVSGHPETGPAPPGLQVGDMAGGMAALIAILSALRVRDSTGRGQFCDVSMTDVVLSWMSMHVATFAATGVPPGLGTESLGGGLACYRTYRCADDRHVAVGALEPRFFTELLDALGLPDELRAAHMDPGRQQELAGLIGAAFADRPSDAWLEVFSGRDACVTPVADVSEALSDSGARARGMVVDDQLPDGTPFPRIGVVPRLEGTPGRIGGDPSPLGADTEKLLSETGRGPEEIAALLDAGVV